MEEQTTTAPRGRNRILTGIVAGLLAGLIAAAFGIASSQGPAGAQAGDDAPPIGVAEFGRRGHKRGFMGGAIHGEFVTRAPSGGYQTLATQVGEVTAVSASSITVKSEDGFSRTYTVDDNTSVNAGNDGIGDVKTGDEVRIVAIVADGKASAVEIRDRTQMEALHEKWRPRRPNASPSPSASNTAA